MCVPYYSYIWYVETVMYSCTQRIILFKSMCMKPQELYNVVINMYILYCCAYS